MPIEGTRSSLRRGRSLIYDPCWSVVSRTGTRTRMMGATHPHGSEGVVRLMVLGRRLSWALVGRQSRLAAMTVRDLVRRPVRIRCFKPMVRSLRSSTLELGLPWLPFALIDHLAEVLADRSAVVFEYGGGGSTLWFSERARSVITVEHDEQWVRVLTERLGETGNVQLAAIPGDDGFDSYIRAIGGYPDDHFDVVVVDGRRRVDLLLSSGCLQGEAWRSPDSGRHGARRYRSAFAEVDWPRETYVGFAPCKPTFAYTAVLARPPGKVARRG